MKKKSISNHELALNAVAASRKKLQVSKATAKERSVIRRSYERGDTGHGKGRLS
jgi:hypothetical protein